ncbi:ribosome silencing factor [Prevotella sp. oral taxon 475]|jgi:iojap-like protein|uniref:ribosome silencing factor n=1 Tax=Prevotella sp. oral taxon 475 TaxID=712471 RepID=UPI001BA79B51|nr:ribosome silencing factor [Prevotella sp. oral taxon 475]QUB46534.1 ribosome silencing factor [Prevotella sp. oral taxon 475]
MTETKRLVETITKGIQEKKGSKIVVADLNGVDGAIANYFVICQGNSPTQIEAIAESIGETVRKELKEKPTHVVGLGLNQWVAIDFVDVMVHVFLPEMRTFYDLEHLWADAKLTHLPDLD